MEMPGHGPTTQEMEFLESSFRLLPNSLMAHILPRGQPLFLLQLQWDSHWPEQMDALRGTWWWWLGKAEKRACSPDTIIHCLRARQMDLW